MNSRQNISENQNSGDTAPLSPRNPPYVTPPPSRLRCSREVRRIRILGIIRNGARYDEIAGAEGITRERVRQIVLDSLRRDDFEKEDHRRVQAARLEPALRLALDAVEEGRLEGVDRLIRVLAAQDKYLAQTPNAYDREDVRERLLQKLRQAARPLPPEIEAKMNEPTTTVFGGELCPAPL